MSSFKISELQQAPSTLGTDELVIARGNSNFKLTATQLNQLGLLPANNLSDVGDVATALANLGGVPTSGLRGLKLYDDIVLITEGGVNGDYGSVSAAMTAATGPATYYVIGDVTDDFGFGGYFTPSYDFVLVVTPGSSIDMGFLSDFLRLTGSVSGIIYNYGSWIRCTFGSSMIYMLDNSSLEYYGGELNPGGGIGISVQSSGCRLVVENVHIYGSGFGIVFAQVPAAEIRIRNCYAWGTTAGFYADVAYANAPIYHCVDEGAFPFWNITFEAGNTSNLGF